MTNRELLELAALAAGYKYTCTQRLAATAHCVVSSTIIVIDGNDWNPLEDDGDCARLENHLLMYIEHFDDHVECMDYDRNDCAVELYEDHGNDKNRARRFASVSVAAEIGRGMKEGKV